jgi:hypothetical protein
MRGDRQSSRTGCGVIVVNAELPTRYKLTANHFRLLVQYELLLT